MLEQLNKVEMTGTVGTVSIQRLDGKNAAHFSVVTTIRYGRISGSMVYETTWHTVRCSEGKGINDLDKLGKGVLVHLVGRLRNYKYITSEGAERTGTEIVASRLEVLEGDQLPPQQL